MCLFFSRLSNYFTHISSTSFQYSLFSFPLSFLPIIIIILTRSHIAVASSEHNVVCVLFAEWCSLRWNGFARKNSDKEMKNDQFCTHKTLVGFESVRFNENFSGLNYPPLSIQSSTVITIVDGLRTSEQDH